MQDLQLWQNPCLWLLEGHAGDCNHARYDHDLHVLIDCVNIIIMYVPIKGLPG